AFQDSVVEFTVVLKLNQGVPEIGRNRFRAAFCVTFFRKKVTKAHTEKHVIGKHETSGFMVSHPPQN
ncbi:MAG: hypothetical protein ACTHMM_27060, partial [Agriterribacter sp.]